MNKKILVVDDEEIIRENLHRILTEETYDVSTVASGREGLDFIANNDIDIVLLDLNLPGTDGREVLRTIKQDENLKKIPVIVLTTSTNEKDIEGCYAAGASSYLSKPVDLGGFMASIQRLTDYWFEIVILPRGE